MKKNSYPEYCHLVLILNCIYLNLILFDFKTKLKKICRLLLIIITLGSCHLVPPEVETELSWYTKSFHTFFYSSKNVRFTVAAQNKSLYTITGTAELTVTCLDGKNIKKMLIFNQSRDCKKKLRKVVFP